MSGSGNLITESMQDRSRLMRMIGDVKSGCNYTHIFGQSNTIQQDRWLHY